MEYIRQFPELASYLEDADHVDVKTVEGIVTLREFAAAMLSYQPGWLTFLYGVRAGFVRLLGMKQEGIPRPPHIDPAELPMSPGEMAHFFEVQQAEEDRFWIVGADDKHLSAWLAIVAEPLEGALKRFHVATIVKYNHWTGPVYFTVIKPFHHLIVLAMVRRGVKSSPRRAFA